MTEVPKISDDDFERLKDHVRLLHGLKQSAEELPRKVPLRRLSNGNSADAKVSSTDVAGGADIAAGGTATVNEADEPDDSSITSTPTPVSSSAQQPRANKTYIIRKQCIQKRLQGMRGTDSLYMRELKRMHDLNLRPKTADYFKLNKAFHMRWKNIRGLPVVHSHFRHAFLDSGKPPFVVPVHYKPFNVYWDADWAKQEFIFLDAASDDKKKGGGKKKEDGKKEEKPTSTPTASSAPEQTDGTVRESLTSAQQQQQPLPSDNQMTQMTPSRKDRESTGYEGMPRDSVLEQQQKSSYMADVGEVDGSTAAECSE